MILRRFTALSWPESYLYNMHYSSLFNCFSKTKGVGSWTMKLTALILMGVGIGLLSADPVQPKVGDDLGTITTTDGKTYSSAKLAGIEPTGISILDSDGGAKISFDKLSPELQQRFGYEPQKAAAYAQQQAYETKIAQLEDDNAKLRAALARYQGALAEQQAKPAVTVSRNGYLYFYNNLVNQSGTVMGNKSKPAAYPSGPLAGMSPGEGKAYAQQQWAALSHDQQLACEKSAQMYGPGPDPDVPSTVHSYNMQSNGMGGFNVSGN